MGDIVRGSAFILQDLAAPQLRKDPVTGRWTIFSTERARKPVRAPHAQETCPFCAGNECETPPELLAVRSPSSPPNGPGWRVRVTPNRYAAIRADGVPQSSVDGLFEQTSGVGSHEVIIECPQHESSLGRLPTDHLRDLIAVWRDRLNAHQADPRLRYVKLFKNRGAESGASLEHSHSQLLALPVVPGITQEEIGSAERYYQQHGRCIFCVLLAEECARRSRLILESPHFVACTAYAGRWPFETWILPRRHASRFESLNEFELYDLAETLRLLLRKFDIGLLEPPYNLVLHTAPLHVTDMPHYHWHFELLPRLTQPAGFEWGTGWHINPVPPEQAAAYLRDVEIERHDA